MTNAEILALHRDLVGIKSLSHEEREIANWAYEYLKAKGAKVWRVGDNVLAQKGSGPKLLLNTHLDTVPPTESWARDPWTVSIEDGRVFGLGSNDAKASAAAMIAAFINGGPCQVILMLACEEETGGKGTEIAWPWLQEELGWTPDGVVVGEPTELQIGISQKGLLSVDLVVTGTACHSANADSLGFRNAAYALAEDLLKLESLDFGFRHPYLGKTTLQPTVLSGSTARNQTPGAARAALDIRSVPGRSHEELLEWLRSQVQGEIEVRSDRLEPYSCPEDAWIVQAAKLARPESIPFGSSAMSDQVFFQGVSAIKCGPGVSSRSHTADEYVLESEILAGAEFYTNLIQQFASVRS